MSIRALTALAVVAVISAGCATGPDADVIDAQVIVSTAGSTGSEARIAGQLTVTDDGCLGVSVAPGRPALVVVWPRGSSATARGVEVDGRRLDVGDEFSGAGGASDVGGLPGGVWYPPSCGDGEVWVLDTLDPDTAST